MAVLISKSISGHRCIFLTRDILEDVIAAAAAAAAAFVFTGKEREKTISRVVLLDEISRRPRCATHRP